MVSKKLLLKNSAPVYYNNSLVLYKLATMFGESEDVKILKIYLERNSVNVLLACAVSIRASELITT